MNKEEILAKSRKENKNQDLYEKEIGKSAGEIGGQIALALALIIYIAERLTTGGKNYAVFAVMTSYFASYSIYRYVKLKQKKYLWSGVIGVVGTVVFIGMHIMDMLRLW